MAKPVADRKKIRPEYLLTNKVTMPPNTINFAELLASLADTARKLEHENEQLRLIAFAWYDWLACIFDPFQYEPQWFVDVPELPYAVKQFALQIIEEGNRNNGV